MKNYSVENQTLTNTRYIANYEAFGKFFNYIFKVDKIQGHTLRLCILGEFFNDIMSRLYIFVRDTRTSSIINQTMAKKAGFYSLLKGLYHNDVAVFQWITSCHKTRMTTIVITLWRVDVTSMTMRFLLEILPILKAIKSHFKGSYDKQNLTLVVILYEIYETRSFHKFHMKFHMK